MIYSVRNPTMLFEEGDLLYINNTTMIVKEDANDNVKLSEVTFDGPWYKIVNMILAKIETVLNIQG